MKIRFKSEEELLETRDHTNRDIFLKCKSKDEIQRKNLFFDALEECVENKDLNGIIEVSTLYINSFCDKDKV